MLTCRELDDALGLSDLAGAWIDHVLVRRPQTTIVLDTDSSVSETRGAKKGSACNGNFACTCCHPLFVFNQSLHCHKDLLSYGR